MLIMLAHYKSQWHFVRKHHELHTCLSKSNGHIVAKEHGPNLGFEKQQRHFVRKVCASMKGFAKQRHFLGTEYDSIQARPFFKVVEKQMHFVAKAIWGKNEARQPHSIAPSL